MRLMSGDKKAFFGRISTRDLLEAQEQFVKYVVETKELDPKVLHDLYKKATLGLCGDVDYFLRWLIDSITDFQKAIKETENPTIDLKDLKEMILEEAQNIFYLALVRSLQYTAEVPIREEIVRRRID